MGGHRFPPSGAQLTSWPAAYRHSMTVKFSTNVNQCISRCWNMEYIYVRDHMPAGHPPAGCGPEMLRRPMDKRALFIPGQHAEACRRELLHRAGNTSNVFLTPQTYQGTNAPRVKVFKRTHQQPMKFTCLHTLRSLCRTQNAGCRLRPRYSTVPART